VILIFNPSVTLAFADHKRSEVGGEPTITYFCPAPTSLFLTRRKGSHLVVILNYLFYRDF
jgi:hypothetical protein